MKKRTSRVIEPSAGSLIELPEVVLSAAARRNPFASRIAAHGIDVVHDGPTASSLKAIPGVELTSGARANPYAKRLTAELQRVRVGKGRPRAGESVGPTRVRSIRLPDTIWEALEREAARSRLTLHAVLRAAITSFLQGRLEGASIVGRRRR